ncbi:MAG: hypothetical protein KGL53_06390, partial [Elusimicrobia bacterium]|nr:hypothetical protein [Elusimicrobiota bacterium]
MSAALAALHWEDWSPCLAAGDHAEVYLEEGRALALTREDGRLVEAAESGDAGAGLRVLARGPGGLVETRFGSLTGFDPDAARALA